MQDIDDLLSGKKISPQTSADGHARLDVSQKDFYVFNMFQAMS